MLRLASAALSGGRARSRPALRSSQTPSGSAKLTRARLQRAPNGQTKKLNRVCRPQNRRPAKPLVTQRRGESEKTGRQPTIKAFCSVFRHPLLRVGLAESILTPSEDSRGCQPHVPPPNLPKHETELSRRSRPPEPGTHALPRRTTGTAVIEMTGAQGSCHGWGVRGPWWRTGTRRQGGGVATKRKLSGGERDHSAAPLGMSCLSHHCTPPPKKKKTQHSTEKKSQKKKTTTQSVTRSPTTKTFTPGHRRSRAQGSP